MGKGDRKHKRRRQRAKQQMQGFVVGNTTTGSQPTTQATDGKAERPTAERMAHGHWSAPQGMGKHERPFVDLHADMIGRLFEAGDVTPGQEQAARHWQQLRARYIQELPDVASFKSCIAGSVPGFDDGDGDPDTIAEYRQLERRLSRVQRIEVLHVCEDGHRPRRLDVLRAALNVIAGVDTGRKIAHLRA